MATTPPEPPAPTDVLNGWKEIAAHLGKSPRSVQRWERELGLPVHRIPTPDGGSIVYAHRSEIDAWREHQKALPLSNGDEEPAAANGSSPAPPSTRARTARIGSRLRAAAVGASLLAAGIAIGARVFQPSAAAVEIRLVGRAVEALGSTGAIVWSHRMDREVRPFQKGRIRPIWVDLDGDGRDEVVVPVGFGAPGRHNDLHASDAVLAFSREGRLLWQAVPSQPMRFGTTLFSPPWRLEELILNDRPPRRLWVVYSHHTSWPAFVLEIDGRGRATRRYVHQGRLFAGVHWRTAGGDFLALGGLSRAFDEATIVLLPATGPPAAFPLFGPNESHCDGCAAAPPAQIWRFPGTDVTRALRQNSPRVQLLRQVGSSLSGNIGDQNGASQIVTIGDDLIVRTFALSQGFRPAHLAMEEQGRLTHPYDACGELEAARAFHAWRPEIGWSPQTVVSSLPPRPAPGP